MRVAGDLWKTSTAVLFRGTLRGNHAMERACSRYCPSSNITVIRLGLSRLIQRSLNAWNYSPDLSVRPFHKGGMTVPVVFEDKSHVRPMHGYVRPRKWNAPRQFEIGEALLTWNTPKKSQSKSDNSKDGTLAAVVTYKLPQSRNSKSRMSNPIKRLVSSLVGALSPVNHKVLYQG